VKHPSKLVNIGDEIEAVVLKVDRDDEKISLGMKQIEEDPWLALPVKYPTGTRVQGQVRNLTSFGAFVEIEPGIDGLIHISDLSWTRRVQHPSEVLRKADDVEVVVLGVDAENKRISLGLKQTEDDPWSRLVDQYAPGVESRGTVVRLLDEGVVVDLGGEVEGFVPNSQIGIEGLKDAADHLKEGQELELRVLESDAANRRIVLTVIAIPDFEGGATPEGTELAVETEVRPVEAQIEDQAVAPESMAPADVPSAELLDEATQQADEVAAVLAVSEQTTQHEPIITEEATPAEAGDAESAEAVAEDERADEV
jgi:small subunit ribosomal protein S1